MDLHLLQSNYSVSKKKIVSYVLYIGNKLMFFIKNITLQDLGSEIYSNQSISLFSALAKISSVYIFSY